MHDLTATDLAGIVYEPAEQVLETMSFCRVFGKSSLRPSSDAVSAHLRFEGDQSGSLTMGITPAAASLIASTFLGSEPNQTRPSEVEQVASELASVELTCPPCCSIAVNLEIGAGLFTTYLTFDALEIRK